MATRHRSHSPSPRPASRDPSRGARVTSLHAALDDTIERYGPVQIPSTWLWSLAGVLLIPIVWSLFLTVWSSFTLLTVDASFWRSAPFWFFHLGLVVWSILFMALRGPHLLFLYVFGHEWTHALFTVLSGGKILRGPYISASGGHLVTDRTNVLISLSPYFFPFYSVLVCLLILPFRVFTPFASAVSWTFFLLLGLTWAFHITFTLSMVLHSQPDLEHRGRFFSLLFILLVNLVILALLLVLAAPGLSWGFFLGEFSQNVVQILHDLAALAQGFAHLWSELHG